MISILLLLRIDGGISLIESISGVVLPEDSFILCKVFTVALIKRLTCFTQTKISDARSNTIIKGYYSDRKCIHTPSGLGQTVVTFDISLRSCAQLQEVWDQARKLRCTWYDFYEKSVTFQPYRVNTLDPVTANFLGDNLRCWMQIQVGKGPHASEVSGIVKIGQTMTMVLGIKDDENKFDMMIRNCVAHDGLRSPITLVNERGSNVLAFAYFQAFKFPDSMNVHFQCVVQVCRDYCPDPICSDKTVSDAYESNRGSLLSHRNSNSVINPRSIIEPSNLPGAINNKSTRSLESYRSVDDSKKIAREINVKLETPLNNKHDSSKKISMNNSKSNDDKIYLKKSYSERVRNKRNTHSLVQQHERIRSSTARKIETERVDVETKKERFVWLHHQMFSLTYQ
ncbi:unnamed protein product [Lepeophtheirus salmonis]|uniref:(salmon louse) hypothetical protein n=1 Tax=Lepeophtheirus salmonis TaxID=72036 RepID=A0A7R8H2I3_LEPSM|nr:unnamed protein product [Lepeophtheirus salmonis]CAF2815263.1 unnamed protein product [Lepeophtheirus salmonis]